MNENYYLANVHQVTTQLQCLIVIIKVKFKNRICKMSDSVVQSTLFKYLRRIRRNYQFTQVNCTISELYAEEK